MKINTISTYVLVYLLTNGHWNLMVPVKADGGSKSGSDAGSTAGSDAGSTAGSDVAEVSTLGTDGSTSCDANASLATPANEADGSSSSAGADAGSSLPSGSSGESADASLASVPAEGTSSSGESADASLASVPAEGTSSGEDGSSGHAAQTVLLNGLYPESHSGGAHSYEETTEDPIRKAYKDDANRLAADARKAAEELMKAAEKLNKEAEELSKVTLTASAEELKAKIDLTAAKVQVEMKQADKIAHENDMTYYSGFPNGWHVEHDPVREKDELLSKTMMYRGDFPNPWHDMNWPMLDEANKNREKKYKEDKEGMKVKIDGKEAQIVLKEEQIASKNTELLVKKEELEEKSEELYAKKQEVTDMKELIKELQKDLKKLEAEAKIIASEHSTINRDVVRLDIDKRKLDEERDKLNNEFLNLLEDDRNLVRAFYDTSASIGYLHEKHTGGTYGLYSETDRKVDPRDTFSPYNVEVERLKHYDPNIRDQVTKSYFGDLYPDMGGSLVIVRTAKPDEDVVDKKECESSESSPQTHTASTDSTALPSTDAFSGAGQPKVEEAVPEAEGSGAAHTVPGAGSHGAKPESESAKAKAPEAEDKAEAAAVPETKPEEAAPVSTPAHTATHVAAPPAKPLAQAAPATPATSTGVKFYKEGADGKEVELVENTDYTKKNVAGDDKYEFKASSPCVKVTFDGNEVWKKGDQSVDAPVSVSYREMYNAIVVRDDTKSVTYKKKPDKTWVYDTTITRAAKTGSSGRTAASARGTAGGSTTNLASASAKLGGSVTNLSAGSTTGSDEGKSTGTEDVANLKEVEEDTSGSGSAGSASTTTLRGSASASPRAH
ncbi:conserved hypothetical protein [Theileria orientalis strain Shintoku]|uniref:Uncharacterized protein n=1 Tax=Theileria orientalis strain Shintoku TaxID=869250 RepID=J4DQ09_THEOR|nr:conserved hypothetical protein [Theileria orientalis strain Shintoku]BAM41634.1 conserved hypothetical protein [Theileria orientalis strain Shintoku]|eukprot:XP_009691935.1 conserved hypothetical protein [Theileria orientalis strain Shintoku]